MTQLSDQELLRKLKTIKTNKVIDATVIGLTIGIVIYGAVKSGLSFFTLFPLILTFIIVRNSKNNQLLEMEITKELKSRKLN